MVHDAAISIWSSLHYSYWWVCHGNPFETWKRLLVEPAVLSSSGDSGLCVQGSQPHFVAIYKPELYRYAQAPIRPLGSKFEGRRVGT